MLLFVTPSRKGEEREEMVKQVTVPGQDYDPHARETGLRRRGGEHEAPSDAPVPEG